ncbi:hypothetical protein TRVL_05392 [Trypanosoma vivax]|nr:hypothetical protein TRVL_05392 [Trypanosoma vivax]
MSKLSCVLSVCAVSSSPLRGRSRSAGNPSRLRLAHVALWLGMRGMSSSFRSVDYVARAASCVLQHGAPTVDCPGTVLSAAHSANAFSLILSLVRSAVAIQVGRCCAWSPLRLCASARQAQLRGHFRVVRFAACAALRRSAPRAALLFPPLWAVILVAPCCRPPQRHARVAAGLASAPRPCTSLQPRVGSAVDPLGARCPAAAREEGGRLRSLRGAVRDTESRRALLLTRVPPTAVRLGFSARAVAGEDGLVAQPCWASRLPLCRPMPACHWSWPASMWFARVALSYLRLLCSCSAAVTCLRPKRRRAVTVSKCVAL